MKSFFKKVLNRFEYKSGDEFDFQAHLLNNNFANTLVDDKHELLQEHIKIYSHKQIRVKIIIDLSKQTVSVFYDSDLISLLNFIPNGELFSEMFITQVVSGIKNIR